MLETPFLIVLERVCLLVGTVGTFCLVRWWPLRVLPGKILVESTSVTFVRFICAPARIWPLINNRCAVMLPRFIAAALKVASAPFRVDALY